MGSALGTSCTMGSPFHVLVACTTIPTVAAAATTTAPTLTVIHRRHRLIPRHPPPPGCRAGTVTDRVASTACPIWCTHGCGRAHDLLRRASCCRPPSGWTRYPGCRRTNAGTSASASERCHVWSSTVCIFPSMGLHWPSLAFIGLPVPDDIGHRMLVDQQQGMAVTVGVHCALIKRRLLRIPNSGSFHGIVQNARRAALVTIRHGGRRS